MQFLKRNIILKVEFKYRIVFREFYTFCLAKCFELICKGYTKQLVLFQDACQNLKLYDSIQNYDEKVFK